MSTLGPLDPVCLFHGLKASEHPLGFCLFCCLCFKTLTIEECHDLPDGGKEDVCNECAEFEEEQRKAREGE